MISNWIENVFFLSILFERLTRNGQNAKRKDLCRLSHHILTLKWIAMILTPRAIRLHAIHIICYLDSSESIDEQCLSFANKDAQYFTPKQRLTCRLHFRFDWTLSNGIFILQIRKSFRLLFSFAQKWWRRILTETEIEKFILGFITFYGWLSRWFAQLNHFRN